MAHPVGHEEIPAGPTQVQARAETPAPIPAAAGATCTPAGILGLQRAIGNRRTTAVLSRAPARSLARYKIMGPWASGQAVHETLTVLAVGKAIEKLKAAGSKPGDLLDKFDTSKLPKLSDPKGHEFDPEYADASFQQFIRGVVWADDPKGLLFDSDADATNYSSALMWGMEFKSGESGSFEKDQSDLIARSHFGNLQFFHGMATSDTEAATVTKQHMLTWARFLIDVAANRIGATTLMKDTPVKDLFPANADWPVKRLFCYAKGTDLEARQRAVGILFHMIQDSYAHGHVERDGGSGDVTEFHAYGGQDEHKHGDYDYFAKGTDLGDRISKTMGASTGLDRCANVLVMIAEGKTTDEIVNHIDAVILKLSPTAHGAGPGAGLGKPPPAPKVPRELDGRKRPGEM